MAQFKSYGVEFGVPDKFTPGMPLDEKTAARLNATMAEFISHRIRSGVFKDLQKGQTPSEEQIATAKEQIAKLAESFEFGAERASGEPRAVDPVGKEALVIARAAVKSAIAKAGKTLGKKGEESEDPNVYPFDTYAEKVKAYAELPETIKRAKAAVKARGGVEEVEVEL